MKDSFVLTKHSTDYSQGSRILIKGSFRCYKSGVSKSENPNGSVKTNCPFKLNFRRHALSGIYSFTTKHVLSHNHPMDPVSTVVASKARRLTSSQINLVDAMHAMEVPISRITEVLQKKTRIKILNKDLYNSKSRSERAHIDGLCQVQDLLMALRDNEEAVYKVGSDANSELKWLTFATRNALAQFGRMSFVLLMDATYKTNTFDMPLLLFSSVDHFGRSYIVACSLLTDEQTSSYDAALASFKQLFGPAVPRSVPLSLTRSRH